MNNLEYAVELATRSAQVDGGPFGAVIILPDGRRVEGTNRVTATSDPTAHAEVTAIREAGRLAGTNDLSGAVLYTSCQPCPMCMCAALWARIGKIVYAADADEAADAGFDDREFYNQLRSGVASVTSAMVERVALDARMEPFHEFQKNPDHTDY